MSQLIRIRKVSPLENFVVLVEFTDGAEREIDLEPFLHGPVFEPMRNDPEMFRQAQVDPQMKTLVWPNGADLDPDVLYHNFTPVWMEPEVEMQVA